MKIIVVSDTHGSKNQLDKILPVIKKADMFIHCGDHFQDSLYIYKKSGISSMAVKGNCDFDKVESDLVFDIEGVKIFLTHGHRYGVKWSLGDLAAKAKEHKADLAIFGHTHITYDEFVDGVRILNPGSLTLPRSGNKRTYIELEINNGKVSVFFNELT